MLYVARCLFSVRKVLPRLGSRYLKTHFSLSPLVKVTSRTMASVVPNAVDKEAELAPLRKLVQEQVSTTSAWSVLECILDQAEIVRRLKTDGRPKLEVTEAVDELKRRKKALERREAQLTPKEKKFDRSGLENLLKRSFFYDQSFAIYGGIPLVYVCVCVSISHLVPQVWGDCLTMGHWAVL